MNTASVGYPEVAQCVPTLDRNQLGMIPTALPPTISRARLKQLFALAYETVEWLESKGLKKGEQCEFR